MAKKKSPKASYWVKMQIHKMTLNKVENYLQAKNVM